MENPFRRKPTKRSKQKKKPVRVVYISNPMKIRTSASRFRSLVQELTGQDAELPDPTKFMDADDVDSNQTIPDATKIVGDDHEVVVPTVREAEQEKAAERDDDGDLDDDFTPQLLENLAPSFFYESVHPDILRNWSSDTLFL